MDAEGLRAGAREGQQGREGADRGLVRNGEEAQGGEEPWGRGRGRGEEEGGVEGQVQPCQRRVLLRQQRVLRQKQRQPNLAQVRV